MEHQQESSIPSTGVCTDSDPLPSPALVISCPSRAKAAASQRLKTPVLLILSRPEIYRVKRHWSSGAWSVSGLLSLLDPGCDEV